MMEPGANGMPLVSVIIPTYNRIHTLPVSIDSILCQTYTNLEVVVVDDGSTDGTEEFVRGLADGKVRYVKNAGNRGPATARNLGVKLAKGEYVAFQDSDDEWHSDKLEKQMALLLDPRQKTDMVYCEFTRYHGQTKCELMPPKEFPADCKRGNIFSVLLLQPLIGTPTIVIKKQCFVQAGGFNESLKTFEDYEFTLRFSQKHIIGFVEESLVKENDSPDSVDKRFADRIRVQAYIVREMIKPLRKYDLLWEKLSAVQRAAEHLKCHDVFLEELQGLADLFITEQEKENAARLAEKTEQSDAKQNQYKEIACEALAHAKQQILEVYISLYGDETVGNAELGKALEAVQNSIEECEKLFKISSPFRCVCSWVYEGQISAVRLERLSLLADVVREVENMTKQIEQQRIECNVCRNIFFKNESHKCPFCDAEDRERLLISFLQELQPEEGDVLHIYQMTQSRLLNNYMLNREDILCEIPKPHTDSVSILRTSKKEQYDLLICPLSSERTDYTDSVWREVSRVMKPGGICLLLPPLDHGERDYTEGLDSWGFYVNIVGENWFGEDFYRIHGFDNRQIILALTKGRALTEM